MTAENVADLGAPRRDFSGIHTQYVVKYLQACTPEGTLERILQSAGETRTAATLSDAGTWSSYGQFRKLLEATSAELGGPAALNLVGEYSHDRRHVESPELMEAMLALGSPAAVFAALSGFMETTAPDIEMKAESAGANECRVEFRVKDDNEPFRELCVLEIGLLGAVPTLFGFPGAEIVHETCQCDGAPSCQARLQWESADESSARLALAELRFRVSEARLEELQHTVAELVSGDGLQAVLTRVVAAAARAVQAASYVLEIGATAVSDRWLYAEGLDTAEGNAVVDGLCDTSPTEVPAHVFVTEVVSDRSRYGRLVAIRSKTASFEPLERSVLESYGRLAASALDSETAIVDARRQATAARALLALSSSLADLSSTEEMVLRLARAVPSVIDCDHVVVTLTGSGDGIARVRATSGFDHATEVELRSLAIPIRLSRAEASMSEPFGVFRHQLTAEKPSAFSAALAGAGSLVAFASPIVYNNEMYGWITVAVNHRPERLADNAAIGEQLQGLASQAALAIRNARLLDEIRHQALHDSLTGLPNRVLIVDRVNQTLMRARREHLDLALLFIDLDGFKDVNDTFGHAMGDKLLKAVAARFTGTLRESDTVARLGGDEFVVLAEGLSLAAGPELVAERLLAVLEEPFRLNDDSASLITISASIGIAAGLRDSGEELLRDADVALYAAKDAGKNCYRIFEAEMHAALRSRHELDMDLQAAVGTDQFFLLYQPIFNLVDMTVVGVEALLRWRHPTRGLLESHEFIPALEATGLIIPVGRWVLLEACRQAMTWRQEGQDTTMSVNASGRQLDTDSLLDDVRSALATTGFPAESLIIEITETCLMRDTTGARQQLVALKSLGVRIAIDDFGTGYSSLSYLQQFPVDCLKIDRSFISGMAKSPEGDALMHTLMQLGKVLHLETLAEGIEEPGQLTQLQAEQCDSGQGFLFARPLTPEAVQKFLKATLIAVD